jgi:hypothetical protein
MAVAVLLPPVGLSSLDGDRRVSAAELAELPMTLLGAIRSGDELLVGADGQLVVTDARSEAAESKTVEKLHRIPGQLLVWGYVGSDDVGQPMREFFDAVKLTDWQALGDASSLRLHEVVRDNPNPHRSEVLIAGYLGGKLGIWTADETGCVSSSPNLAFSGYGRVAARVGWRTIQRLAPALSFEERVRHLWTETIDEVYGLGPPLSLWRITPDSCERV